MLGKTSARHPLRLSAALVLTVALLLGASPAWAIWKGQVCRSFPGPDGGLGVHIQACLNIDDHDFEPKIRALVEFSNPGTGRADIHVSYMKLIKDGVGTIRDTGPFRVLAYPNSVGDYVTTYVNNPHGTYHSRIRMWVCWPTLAGDPCGSITVWNSADVRYS
jgi:hypothetical protein